MGLGEGLHGDGINQHRVGYWEGLHGEGKLRGRGGAMGRGYIIICFHEGAEVDDVGFVTARTMSLDLLGSKRRSAAPPPSYLTIIRGPDVGGGDTVPPVPTRAKR